MASQTVSLFGRSPDSGQDGGSGSAATFVSLSQQQQLTKEANLISEVVNNQMDFGCISG